MVVSADVFIEFAEACVHQILYSKALYPAQVFEKRFKYGQSVFQSRHPEINSYIREVLGNAHPLVNAGLVDSIVLNIFRDGSGDSSGRDMNTNNNNHKDYDNAVPVESISLSCVIKNRESAATEPALISEQALLELESEMKNALIDLIKLSKLCDDGNSSSGSGSGSGEYTWQLEVHTSKDSVGFDTHKDAVLRESLKSQQWRVVGLEQGGDAATTASSNSNINSDVNSNSSTSGKSTVGIRSLSNLLFDCNLSLTLVDG
jgi:hypothetical protein